MRYSLAMFHVSVLILNWANKIKQYKISNDKKDLQ